MTDTDPIKRAQTLITDLNKAYQACKQATADDVRFQEQLNSILGFLTKAETVDNRVLIELEKFYQTSSLLMGLSALDPDAPTRAAWRAYDRFHLDQEDQVEPLWTNHYLVVTKKKLRQTCTAPQKLDRKNLTFGVFYYEINL